MAQRRWYSQKNGYSNERRRNGERNPIINNNWSLGRETAFPSRLDDTVVSIIIFCYIFFINFSFWLLNGLLCTSALPAASLFEWRTGTKKVTRFWMAFNGITGALLHSICLCAFVGLLFLIFSFAMHMHTRIRITKTIITVCLVMRALFAACSWNVHFLLSFPLHWLSSPLWKRFSPAPATSKFHFLTNGEFRGNVVSFANHVERLCAADGCGCDNHFGKATQRNQLFVAKETHNRQRQNATKAATGETIYRSVHILFSFSLMNIPRVSVCLSVWCCVWVGYVQCSLPFVIVIEQKAVPFLFRLTLRMDCLPRYNLGSNHMVWVCG